MRLKASWVSFPFLVGFTGKTQEAGAASGGVPWKSFL